MNVLHWVRSTSQKFKVDVGNRIAQVQETSESSQWNHVSGKMNPADKATRGLLVDKLAMDNNWWHGPDFLSKVQSSWPRKEIIPPEALPGETKRKTVSTFEAIELPDASHQLHPSHFSSWKKLLRKTSLCKRFLHRLRAKLRGETAEETQTQTVQELEDSARHWCSVAMSLLTTVSSDADDPRPITPMSFLVGHMNVSTALEVEQHHSLHPRRRWSYLQKLI